MAKGLSISGHATIDIPRWGPNFTFQKNQNYSFYFYFLDIITMVWFSPSVNKIRVRLTGTLRQLLINYFKKILTPLLWKKTIQKIIIIFSHKTIWLGQDENVQKDIILKVFGLLPVLF